MHAARRRIRGILGPILGVCLAASCSSGGGANPPPNMMAGADLAMVDPNADMAVGPGADLAMPPQDLAGKDIAGPPDLVTIPPDLATPADMTMPPDLAGGMCTPGSYRCGPANSIQICNSTGTAWLHSATCAVACSGGLCTGACSPGERRCNMSAVEQCNGAGTTWTAVETCTGTCSSGRCALGSLDVTMNRTLDGDILVDGDFIVRSGVTVTANSGELTVRAKNIVVENMGTITVAPKGNKYGNGQGGSSSSSSEASGGGGGNGTAGGNGYYSSGGAAINTNTDTEVQGGGNGGVGYPGYSGSGGIGGGVIRLIAQDKITIAGYVTANGTAGTNNVRTYGGGGGGGAGGGILLAATNEVAISGSVSAAGGGGGTGYYTGTNNGGAGAPGRVRILAGSKRTVTGTVTGQRTDGILPPMVVTSSSHPNPDLIYNDDFDMVQIAWVSPFSSRQGYYHLINTSNYTVPTPATGAFVNAESIGYLPSSVREGSNYFHIVPLDAMTNVGTVEQNFRIQINTRPVTVSSSSHPSPTSWSSNADVFFQWSFPVADNNVKGIYYVFDQYGDTIPTKAATLVPLPQKQLLRSSVMPGIWVLHAVAVDQRDYLTKTAGHYRVQIGTDPGTGVVLGQVTDMMGKAIDNATVSINRGLWSQASNSTGNFNFPMVSAGTYELRTTKAGRMPVTQMITVTKGTPTTANVTMP